MKSTRYEKADLNNPAVQKMLKDHQSYENKIIIDERNKDDLAAVEALFKKIRN